MAAVWGLAGAFSGLRLPGRSLPTLDIRAPRAAAFERVRPGRRRPALSTAVSLAPEEEEERGWSRAPWCAALVVALASLARCAGVVAAWSATGVAARRRAGRVLVFRSRLSRRARRWWTISCAAAGARMAAQWPLYATIPACAGVFNALTNKLAVTMMFEPVRYRGVGFLGWQGIVPRAARRMGGDVSDLLTTELLDVNEVVGRVDGAKLADVLVSEDAVVELCRALACRAFPRAPPGLVAAALSRERLARVARRAVEAVQADVDGSVDVRHAVVERLCADPRKLCDLFRTCGRPELDAVVRLGGYGGLLLGLVQMAAWAAYPRAWTLALGGALVGFGAGKGDSTSLQRGCS